MEDKELIEKAAKAAGINLMWFGDDARTADCFERLWNPLTVDGDALRMAVKLKLHILHNDTDESVLWVSAVINKSMINGVVEFADESEREEATRRAITRAAAAMVKE